MKYLFTITNKCKTKCRELSQIISNILLLINFKKYTYIRQSDVQKLIIIIIIIKYHHPLNSTDNRNTTNILAITEILPIVWRLRKFYQTFAIYVNTTKIFYGTTLKNLAIRKYYQSIANYRNTTKILVTTEISPKYS